MAHSSLRRLAALGGCGALAVALQVPVQAAGPTFTRIGTPSGRTTLLISADRPIVVAGTTSPDVTSVDVVCIRGGGADAEVNAFASNVPVSNGAFTTTGTIPADVSVGPICRLRAVPTGVDPLNADVSSYSGPILDLDTLHRLTGGAATYNFELRAGSGNGEMSARSAGFCGDEGLSTVAPDLARSAVGPSCVAGLGIDTVFGSTGALRVDGHPALLPYGVLTYGDGTTSLALKVHTANDGRVTWTETAPLVRCQGTDAYPPPPGQCHDVLATGVSFTRAGTLQPSGHEIRLRDAFTSTDGKHHRVTTLYAMRWTAPETGALGFRFPGSNGFHAGSAGQVVSALPARAATFLVRSDRFADEGDPGADTRAVTWSRPPTRVAFAPDDATVFTIRYALQVPAHGSARLGFTDGEAVLSSTAARIGRRAVADVMRHPAIGSPGRGAVISGRKTVVRGSVRAGVNGLPVTVTVNGHPATLTAKSATRATYKAVFDESLGKHRITAVAKDAGGNTRSASITVRNK